MAIPLLASGGSMATTWDYSSPKTFLAPNFSRRYKILNILFTANTCNLGRCKRNGHDAYRLLLYFSLYKTSL